MSTRKGNVVVEQCSANERHRRQLCKHKLTKFSLKVVEFPRHLQLRYQQTKELHSSNTHILQGSLAAQVLTTAEALTKSSKRSHLV